LRTVTASSRVEWLYSTRSSI